MYKSILFLKSIYDDCWLDYQRSLKSQDFPVWDYVYITASNEEQADYFRKQIKSRSKYLPENTMFVVISDYKNKRVGSGGATLSVIKDFKNREHSFTDKKVLVIHSGGDSKRIPQYSALGKLFSPVPRTLPDGRLSTLFDEIIISCTSVASRIKEGMFILSGDVLLLYNPLQVSFNGKGVACLAFNEKAEIGQNHGVYKIDNSSNVLECLQKYPINDLKKAGAVDEKGDVYIDTGAVIYGTDVLEKLYSLVDNEDKYNLLVNETVRLSMYIDLLYPFSVNATLESFLKCSSEGTKNNALIKARESIWELLSDFKLKALKLNPSKFIHFGTSKEILHLMTDGVEIYKNLGWKKTNGCSFENHSGYNSVSSQKAIIGENAYIECSYVHSKGVVGSNVILSYIDIHDEQIPDNVIVHGLKLKNGKFVVRILGIDDNPKSTKLFGCDLIDSPLLINGDLWNAKIYPVKDTIVDALKGSLNLYNIIKLNKGSISEWKKADKISLNESFNHADTDSLLKWAERQEDLVKIDQLFKLLENKTQLDSARNFLNKDALSHNQNEWLKSKIRTIDFYTKLRLYLYLSVATENDELYKTVFRLLKDEMIANYKNLICYNDSLLIKKESVLIELPLRVNFAGGWTDTPPYSLENGGIVLNSAITLDGRLPVQVKIDKIKENKIIFESKDMDVYGEFTNIEDLQDTGDPYDSFALQKAAVISTGLIPTKGGNLSQILSRMGGGFKIDSEVINVPKGSGLGTSSILSCAVAKAIFNFFGVEYDDNKLFQTVMLMEQVMSTGGGWQDQVGGGCPGFKIVSTQPGIVQNIDVKTLSINDETYRKLNDRFVLIYTGERRLARNLLRDVLSRYLGNYSDSITALSETKKYVNDMAHCLENGDVEGFIKICSKQFELSVAIDRGCCSAAIESIFDSIDDLIDAKVVIGAGGGGFIGAFIRKDKQKSDIINRLNRDFNGLPVGVWNSKFVK